MADQHLEIEQKYDAEAGFILPALDGLPGVAAVAEPKVHELHATYFDTSDLRLAAHGITLRRRRGGDDSGWHLKMPAPQGKREYHASLGRPRVVPARLAGLVAAYARGAELVPVATLETRRTVVVLRDGEDARLAEVADDLVSAYRNVPDGDEAEPRRWREIEVELGSGGPELLKAAGKRLRKAGARKAKSASKLGRLLGADVPPAAGAAARAATRARLRELSANGKAPTVTAGDAVLGYLAAQLEALIEFDPKARLGEEDAVHRMRVASRRLRSTLQAYRPVLDPARTEPLQVELRWLASVLGEVRDLEVLRMRFADGPRYLLDDLARRERGAYRRMNLSLKEPRYFELLDALDRLIAEPPLGERADRKARKELPVLVARVWERMARQYRAIETAEDPDIARHDTRKGAKRARYAAELAVPVLGASAKRAAKDAKRIAEILGAHQDGVLAMEHLGAARGRARTTQDAFTLGVLYGREECRAQEARDRLAVTWSRTLGPSF